jgi:Protein of unknown function DUF262
MKMRSERRAIDKLYKRRDRYEIPDWQREKVWNQKKKQKLIDTILRGWKLPKFYLLKTSSNPEEFEVLDGQQRLSAIWEFFDGDLSLGEESAARFGGVTYDELPDSVSDAFDDYEIEYDEITDALEEDQKEFFQRLQEGLPLTSSEKLNAVHSKLRDYCVKLAKHPFFSETTVVTNKRYAYFDIAAKAMVLEIEGIDSGLRYEDVKAVFDANQKFSGNSAVAKRLEKALDLLHTTFPPAFNSFRNRTIVQSVITLISHLLQSGLTVASSEELRKFIEHFLIELSRQVELGQRATDQDYLTFQRTVNANVRTGSHTRQEILLRKLYRYKPSFFSLLSASQSLSDGVASDIAKTASEIRELIQVTNERYAAKHGTDLFKPTNKTIGALNNIQNTVTDLNEYKKLIENLYFVFREGTGQRLDDQVPESFSDVNDLRTLNEHDVDHGKANKVSAKRKKLSSIFQKYAGVPTPDALDPILFPVAHANILGALVSDLRQLAKQYAGT